MSWLAFTDLRLRSPPHHIYFLTQDTSLTQPPTLRTMFHSMVVCIVQILRAGISGVFGNASSSNQQGDAPEVEDPRQAKRQLAADLSTSAAQTAFASSLADALADEDLLRKCLLPITVTVQVTAYI